MACSVTSRIWNSLWPTYGYGERSFRAIIYEMAVVNGIFERSMMWLYKLFAKGSRSEAVFDTKREDNGMVSLQRLGAQFSTVVPRDQLASVQMMVLSSTVLERKIERLGGFWTRVGSQFVIIPPSENHRAWAWQVLEHDMLRLKWPKKKIEIDGVITEVIVTCEHADVINDADLHNRLFLHSNSAAVTFAMLTRRWGFYLGCKQSICAYNPRGVPSSPGLASESGHCNDILAVYESISTKYAPQDIWISSACGGGPAAAYLQAMHPELNQWIFENGYTNLQDCINLQSKLAKWLASYFVGSLFTRDIPLQDRSLETGYNLAAYFRNRIPNNKGTVVVVSVSNDQVLTPPIHHDNVTFAKQINKRVVAVLFKSKRADGNFHVDRYFCHRKATQKVLEVIFTKCVARHQI